MSRRRSLGLLRYLLVAIGLVTLLGLLIPVSVVRADDVVTFPDPNLDKAVREAIKKPKGGISEADLASLSYLFLIADRESVADLTGLEHCHNLVRLSVHGTFSDLSPLSSLGRLEYLVVASSAASQLSPLSGLTQLRDLAINGGPVADLSPLSSLSSLASLNLNSNQIRDLSPLSKLTSLVELSLRRNQISDLSPLSGLTALTRLNLACNQIKDLSPLSGLTRLTSLSLDENEIGDISAISGFTNLVYLSVNPGVAWQFTCDNASQTGYSPPMIVGDLVCVSDGVALYALRASTGALAWKFKPGGDLPLGNPLEVDGEIAISQGTSIYLLDELSGAVVHELNLTASNSQGTHVAGIVLLENSIIAVDYHQTQTTQPNPDYFYFPFSYPVREPGVFDVTPPSDVYAIDVGSGSLKWQPVTLAGRCSSSPVSYGGVIYVADGRRLVAVNCETGAEVWGSSYLSAWGTCRLYANDGIVYANSAGLEIVAHDSTTGALIWNYRAGSNPSKNVLPFFQEAGILYTEAQLIPLETTATDGSRRVVYRKAGVIALDAKTGESIWDAETSILPSGQPIVLLGSPIHVHAYGDSQPTLETTEVLIYTMDRFGGMCVRNADTGTCAHHLALDVALAHGDYSYQFTPDTPLTNLRDSLEGLISRGLVAVKDGVAFVYDPPSARLTAVRFYASVPSSRPQPFELGVSPAEQSTDQQDAAGPEGSNGSGRDWLSLPWMAVWVAPLTITLLAIAMAIKRRGPANR